MSDKASGRTVGQGSTMLETLYGSLSGMAFGLVSPLASQPFDTLKTKMQAESRFASQSMGSVARQVVRAEGIAGLFRGIVPIVASTGVQKSALFSANAGARRACETSGIVALTAPIPFTSLPPSVIVGGVAAGTARTLVETPFELAKVRFQTGGGVRAATGLLSLGQVAELYTGAAATWARGTVMLTSFFVFCDYSERAAPQLMARPLLGGFLKGGVCATLAWARGRSRWRRTRCRARKGRCTRGDPRWLSCARSRRPTGSAACTAASCPALFAPSWPTARAWRCTNSPRACGRISRLL